ncbi:MAG: DUF488 domain-containing protein [Actinobacteria bacterium]|nr:DUF488 domain-containing protein [Actinomycetota bacterium]
MTSGLEILTVGHSNHEERDFIELLRGAGIGLLIDVRANPRSRYQHFNRSPLAASLRVAGIGYEQLGEQLGGRRTPAPDSGNDSWTDDAFRGYADHMARPEFGAGLAELRRLASERGASGGRTALMCAEADWRRCHRRLIADALVLGGYRVGHLGPDGSLAEHELSDAVQLAGGVVSYPKPQTSLEI